MANSLLKRRARIKKRVRAGIVRMSEYPRMSVHRSNNHMYVQVIDDHKMHTLAAASDVVFKGEKMNRTQKAQKVGLAIAEELKKVKVKQVVFDRGAYPYKGRMKALADAVREAGITI
ncbi:50S ribosomal protein L18 [bacterium]|nr:50S ribosomal protein L18 [bacterium]